MGSEGRDSDSGWYTSFKPFERHTLKWRRRTAAASNRLERAYLQGWPRRRAQWHVEECDVRRHRRCTGPDTLRFSALGTVNLRVFADLSHLPATHGAPWRKVPALHCKRSMWPTAANPFRILPVSRRSPLRRGISILRAEPCGSRFERHFEHGPKSKWQSAPVPSFCKPTSKPNNRAAKPASL